VSLNGLEESKNDPDVDGDDVQASLGEDGLGSHCHEERTSDGAGTEDKDFERVGVFGSETEGGRELVV
jgi:hypothetical protein